MQLALYTFTVARDNIIINLLLLFITSEGNHAIRK